MNLLVATDHRYHRTADGVFDAYCFDRAFFDDYRSEFDTVTVAARMQAGDLPAHAARSDGDGVDFIDLPDVRGMRWALAPSWVYCSALRDAVSRADAVCVRVPSVTGRFAADMALAQGKPLMFEMIGDPVLLMEKWGPAGRLLGRRDARAMARMARRGTVGSYVSRRHLQHAYPAGAGVLTDSISSIRMPRSDVQPPRVFDHAPSPMRVVCVANMIRHKGHAMLLRATARAVERGANLTLDLVGDGPLMQEHVALAASLGITDRVTFHGHVAGRSNVYAVLDAGDLFVLASESEGLPRSLLEGLARGLPAVGTRAAGTDEVLTEEQLVDVDDHEALADLLDRLHAEPALLTAFAAKNAELLDGFTQEVLTQRRRRLLRALAERARGSR